MGLNYMDELDLDINNYNTIPGVLIYISNLEDKLNKITRKSFYSNLISLIKNKKTNPSKTSEGICLKRLADVSSSRAH